LESKFGFQDFVLSKVGYETVILLLQVYKQLQFDETEQQALCAVASFNLLGNSFI
jgi:hypothetical protein